MLSKDECQDSTDGKPTDLTLEELKKFEGFEDMSDEELEAHLIEISRLASVLVDIYLEQGDHE